MAFRNELKFLIVLSLDFQVSVEHASPPPSSLPFAVFVLKLMAQKLTGVGVANHKQKKEMLLGKSVKKLRFTIHVLFKEAREDKNRRRESGEKGGGEVKVLFSKC